MSPPGEDLAPYGRLHPLRQYPPLGSGLPHSLRPPRPPVAAAYTRAAADYTRAAAAYTRAGYADAAAAYAANAAKENGRKAKEGRGKGRWW
ncbi:hypothetical protein N0V90_013528 [Kalmusia sp. IMI 367209]|nr:hypothetical protein N0V90_013528 [Kalmusia sp. IMI 367209]